MQGGARRPDGGGLGGYGRFKVVTLRGVGVCIKKGKTLCLPFLHGMMGVGWLCIYSVGGDFNDATVDGHEGGFMVDF